MPKPFDGTDIRRKAMSYEEGDKVYIKNPKLMTGIGESERDRLLPFYGKECLIANISEGDDYPISLTCGDERVITQFAINEIKISHNVWQGDERSKYENAGKI